LIKPLFPGRGVGERQDSMKRVGSEIYQQEQLQNGKKF
jgi:hypothetical protein